MMDALLRIDWRAPWWGLLALQPVLFWWLARRRHRRLERYADPHLLPWAASAAPRTRDSRLRKAANGLAWLLLALAAAGPRLPINLDPSLESAPRHAMTLYVVLDVSASMAATDIAPTRLERARLELADLLGRLRGERVGLIVFAGQAGVLLPPSDDIALVRRALDNADPALIELPGTRPASGLYLAARRLAEVGHSGAVLLVTDAEADSLSGPGAAALDTAGALLRKQGIPLFILGVGGPGGVPIPLPEGGFAERDGVQVLSRMEPGPYQDLARRTGGRFALARDGDGDWSDLYDHGLALVPGDTPTPDRARAWRELFPWFLAPALALFLFCEWPAAAPALLVLALLAPVTDARAEPFASPALAYQAGHYAEAQTLYLRQGGYAGHFGAGAAAWRLNDYRAAANQFSTALLLARTPRQRADALYNLGNALYGLGRWRGAAEAFQAVLLDRPRDAHALANLAQTRITLARHGGGATPFKSDLRGRRGSIAEGEVNLDWDAPTTDQGFEDQPAGVMADSGKANGASLRGTRSGGSGVGADDGRLRSGLKKLELLGDRPRQMLKAMMHQDQSPTPSDGGNVAPW